MNFNQNYFELFDLGESFQLDVEDLGVRYRRLQKKIHPDRFANASEQEKRVSLQYTVLANEAYKTLKNPVARASYLLALSGCEKSDGNDNGSVDVEFLTLQMELREALEDIGTMGDLDEALSQIDHLRKKVLSMEAALQQEFNQAFIASKLEDAGKRVQEMQYIEKLLAEIGKVEERILDY